MTSSSPLPPLFTRDFIYLMGAHFLQALGFSSMLLLPLYLDFLDASRAEIGSVMAASAVGGLIARPGIAWALDAVGRKRTLASGTILLTLGMFLVYTIDTVGVLAYVMRILFGIGAGACFSGYFTFAADHIPEERRTEGLALFGVTGLIPLLVNPLSSHIVHDTGDLQWFIPMVGAVVCASLIPLSQVTEILHQEEKKRFVWKEVWSSIQSRPLLPVWFIAFAFAGLVSTFFSFSTVTAQDRGIESPTSLWYFYAAGAAVIRISGARLLDRIGPSNLVAPALASYIASVLLCGSSETTEGFLMAGALAGVGHGICFPVLTSQVVSRTPSAHRGSALTMFTAIWTLSGLIIPPIFGAIADTTGDALMFLIAGMGATAFLGGWLVLEHRFSPPTQALAEGTTA